MAEQMDKIVERYKSLWVDIKNKSFENLPEIDFQQINKEALDDLEKYGFKQASKTKETGQQQFLDIVHKLTDQLHYIRDIKDIL